MPTVIDNGSTNKLNIIAVAPYVSSASPGYIKVTAKSLINIPYFELNRSLHFVRCLYCLGYSL